MKCGAAFDTAVLHGFIKAGREDDVYDIIAEKVHNIYDACLRQLK